MQRTCEALVLAYSPDQPLDRGFGGYYIPSCYDIEEAFGYALRKIYGEQEGGFHWADRVRWVTVANLEQLDSRILEGVRKVICGNPDHQTVFEGSFSFLHGKFEHHWVFMKGDLYRFREGSRERALEDFRTFWTEVEQRTWERIHVFMREYTIMEYEKKSRK